MSFLPVITLLLVIVISLLMVRVATVALVQTGLSQQLARFQARSAFTGAGFTTSESEKVTQHPVRRRIIMMLMLLGNAGIVTAIASLMLSLVGARDTSGSTMSIRLLVLFGGMAFLALIAYSKWIDRHVTRAIEWALKRWTDLEVRDYSGLLHLASGYSVVEMEAQPGDWLVERELGTLRLSDEGVLVLGVDCADGTYIGAPRGKTKLTPGDIVILYGPNEAVVSLDKRQAGQTGNWDHHKAVDKQLQERSELDEVEAQAKTPAD